MTRRERLEQIVEILSHRAAGLGQGKTRVPSRKVRLHVN
jgi:hypothetical protein